MCTNLTYVNFFHLLNFQCSFCETSEIKNTKNKSFLNRYIYVIIYFFSNFNLNVGMYHHQRHCHRHNIDYQIGSYRSVLYMCVLLYCKHMCE